MKENLTSINVLIDESGSMSHLLTDTLGGFNQFLSDQKVVPGEATFTLCTFSTDYRLVHDSVAIAGVPNLCVKTYRPAGGTALLDAMGTTIDSVGQKLAAMPEEDRPSKVLFLIITDGEENSSKRFTKDQVASMVAHQRETYSWEFVFMGANMDAISAGQSLGVSASNSMNYSATKGGTKRLFESLSSSVGRYRSSSVKADKFFDKDLVDPKDPKSTP